MIINYTYSSFSDRAVNWLRSSVERCGWVMLCAMPLMIFLGIAVCDAAIIAIAILFLMRSVLHREWSWLQARWVQLGLLLWVYLIIMSPYALMSPKLSFNQALPFGRFIFFAAGLQYWLLASEKNRHALLYAMAAALLLISIDLIFTFFTGLSVLGKSAVQWHNYQHITWIWQRDYNRLVGLNGKMNNGILLAWISTPFLVWMLLSIAGSTVYWRRGLAACAVVMVSVAILLSGERMALLELCFSYVLMFLFIQPLRKILLLVGSLCVTVCLIVLLHNKGLWYRNVESLLQAISTFNQNDYGRIFKASMAIFFAHPVQGVGLKQYFLISSLPEYAVFDAVNSHVQNMYLELLTGTGLIGSLLFLGLFFCWIQQFWKQRVLIKASPIALGVGIALILRSWPLASTTSFFFSWGAITFWWMGAWLLALTQEKADG